MKNIIFIGMPGSGKTSVSREVARRLSMPWFDSDQHIEAMQGISIAKLFQQKGEEYFRKLETKCITELMAHHGAVIALGGGAILNNSELIKKGGMVIYLKRSVEGILSTLETETRPLLSDPESLYALYETRREIYERTCDVTIENDGKIEDTIQRILEEYQCQA